MRESIGATWIFSICLTFIILFTAYLAISVNYAKAFRIKSNIVSMIEENEGYTGGLEERIINYLVSEGYTASGKCDPFIGANNGYYDGWELIKEIKMYDNVSSNSNACIYRRTARSNDDIANCNSYYKVIAFFKFDLPVINYFSAFKVGGETKMIHDFTVNC